MIPYVVTNITVILIHAIFPESFQYSFSIFRPLLAQLLPDLACHYSDTVEHFSMKPVKPRDLVSPASHVSQFILGIGFLIALDSNGLVQL